MEILTILKISSLFASLGLVFTTLEFLNLRNEFGKYGTFGYKLFAITSVGKPMNGLRLFLNRPRNFLHGVLWVRLLSSILCVLVLLLFGKLNSILLLLLFLSTWISNIRCRIGLNGSDGLMFIVISAIALASLFPEGDSVQAAALVFIAGQVILAYVAAGIFKVKSSVWRSGDAILKILSLKTFGASWASKLLRTSAKFPPVASWAVILFECGFVLILVVPHQYVLVVLALGFLFHLSTALVMGLNGFVWAFLAGYPAVFWVNERIWNMLMPGN